MKKIIEFFKNFDKGAFCRTVLFYLSLINEIVAIIGSTTFAQSPIYQWVSLGFLAITGILSWWYNNDYTSFAKLAGQVLTFLKDGRLTEDEVKQLLKYPTENGENEVKEEDSEAK
jgi:SPP1 family holin